MRKFKPFGQALRFLSAQGSIPISRYHGYIQNLLSVGRHLINAKGYRELRSRAFNDWKIACQLEPSCA